MKKHTDLSAMPCSVARSLDRVGEWWSILILRDAFYGLTRFDEFQKSLGIAPNMLSRRLSDLVEGGLLERVLYQERPPRYEYRLTDVGRDFRPVLLAFVQWGNRNFAPDGAPIEVVHRETGQPARLALVDLDTGKEVGAAGYARDYMVRPGPGATEATHARFHYIEAKRSGLAADVNQLSPYRT
jgi:DNA-binding HxlR family transcriptional regulator